LDKSTEDLDVKKGDKICILGYPAENEKSQKNFDLLNQVSDKVVPQFFSLDKKNIYSLEYMQDSTKKRT